MKTKNLILIFLLITIIFSCNKPKEPTTVETTQNIPKGPFLDSITREFAFFKPGSWWVYESDSIMYFTYYDIPDSVDSFKVFMDTIAITNVDSGKHNDSYQDIRILGDSGVIYIKDTLKYSWFKTTFSSNIYHTNYRYWLEKQNYKEYEHLYYKKYDTVYFRGGSHAEAYGSEFYFNSSLSVTSLPEQYEESTENGYFVEELDSMTVKGKIYYNIRHFVGKSSGNNPDNWYHFYWAKNIGLIKYRLRAGKDNYYGMSWWEIVDYDVEQ